MKPRLTRWQRVLALLGLLAFVAMIWRKPEPSYAGKGLSFWVRQLPCTIPAEMVPGWREVPRMRYMGQYYGSEDPLGAIVAVQAIGTNAIPYLLHLLGKTDSDLKRFFAEAMRKGGMRIPEDLMEFAEPMRWQAITAFRALGTNAEFARESLQMKNKVRASTPSLAVELILEGLGENETNQWFKLNRFRDQVQEN